MIILGMIAKGALAIFNDGAKQNMLLILIGFIVMLMTTALSFLFWKNGKVVIGLYICFILIAYSGFNVNKQADHAVSKQDQLEKTRTKQEKALIDAPLVSQLPELPRGCEVASLAMLLNEAGVKVDKLTLAHEVKKDRTPYRKKNGQVFFGNPNDGYVGNMYTYNQPGFGVYHGPISDLAEKYLPGQIIDLTGEDFNVIIYFLNQNTPVWVITNTAFKKLPDQYFETWQTPSGEVDITYKEHAVLVTGYDADYIYFNDPLANEKNRKILKANFIAAWTQMGKQTISYFRAPVKIDK